MSNKLPKVFANKIEKKLNNNKEVYTSINTKKEEKTEKQAQKQKETIKNKINSKTIPQKINEILTKKKYIYKVPVKIQLEDKEIITNIIGKNKNNIITINNELIKIDDIKNIEINEKNE